MKILQKYCLYALSFCMAAVMMLVPIRAEAAYGTISYWDANYYFNNSADVIQLHNTYVNQFSFNGELILPDYVDVTYVGSNDSYYWLIFPRESYVMGTIYQDLTFDVSDISGFSDFGLDVVVSTGKYDDSLTVSGLVTERFNSQITIRVFMTFSEFSTGDGTLYIPLRLDFQCDALVDNSYSDSVPSHLNISHIQSGDIYNGITIYSDIRDLLGYKGDIANQNQQIIDGIQDNTTAVDSAKNGIVSAINSAKDSIITTINNFKAGVDTQFSHLFNNMQAWYDGLTNTINDGIDRLINNYSGTGTTDAANKFDDSAGDLEQVESDLTTITNSSIGSYTESAFDTSVIISLGSSLVYVATWFTNFWDMGGLFGSILNFGLALTVALFILRLRGSG